MSKYQVFDRSGVMKEIELDMTGIEFTQETADYLREVANYNSVEELNNKDKEADKIRKEKGMLTNEDVDNMRKEALEFEFSIVFLCNNTTGLAMVQHETMKNLLEYSKDERFELVIVDNSEEEDEEFRNYLLSIPKIHKHTRLIFNNVNLGGPSGWDIGFRNAHGEYIAFVASDYFIQTPNWLRILQKPLLEDANTAMSGPRYARMSPNLTSCDCPKEDGTSVSYIALDGGMIKRSVLEEIGYLDNMLYPYIADDLYLGISCIAKRYKIVIADLPNSIHFGQRTIHSEDNIRHKQLFKREDIDIMWDRNRQYIKEKFKNTLNKKTWY